MNYNNHVRLVSDDWMPNVVVTYNENGKNALENLRMDQTFATPNEAEQAGLVYAKKWIDDRARTCAKSPYIPVSIRPKKIRYVPKN